MISCISNLRIRPNSSVARFGTAAHDKISSADLQRLNRTSASLYRILLRESKAVASRLGESQNNKYLRGNLLLQPPVDQGDYGSTRSLKRSCTSWKPSLGGAGEDDDEINKTRRIISFFRRWGMSGSTDTEGRKIAATKLILSHIPASYEHLIPPKNTDHDSDIDSDSDEEEEALGSYQCILVSAEDLANAVRSSFLRVGELSDMLRDEFKSNLTKNDIVQLQRCAIDAIPLLNEQIKMCDCTSVGVDEERGIRVIATSRFTGIGKVHPIGVPKAEHMFVYRIRIENIGVASRTLEDDINQLSDETTVQLLGRTWRIQEDVEGSDDNGSDHAPQVVNAPSTGVVGHHPVLKPGDIFEYMSGCQIASPRGYMSGSFHMAVVDTDTKPAQVGDALPAFDFEKGDDRLFEVPVATFALDADIDNK